MWPYTMTTPTDQTLYRTRPFTEFWVVSIEHLRRVWHADWGCLLLRTPGPVPYGICKCSLVRPLTRNHTIHQFMTPFPDLTFYLYVITEYRFPSGIATDGHADRGRLLLRTPGPVSLTLAYVLLVETNPFPELVVIFPDYALRIPLGTFSILLLT